MTDGETESRTKSTLPARRCFQWRPLGGKGDPSSPTGVSEHNGKRRLDPNLRQVDAARLIGCDEMSVVSREKKHRLPALRHTARIVELFGFDPQPEGDNLATNLLHHRNLADRGVREACKQDAGMRGRWLADANIPLGCHSGAMIVRP
jgi:hypothetical protein